MNFNIENRNTSVFQQNKSNPAFIQGLKLLLLEVNVDFIINDEEYEQLKKQLPIIKEKDIKLFNNAEIAAKKYFKLENDYCIERLHMSKSDLLEFQEMMKVLDLVESEEKNWALFNIKPYLSLEMEDEDKKYYEEIVLKYNLTDDRVFRVFLEDAKNELNAEETRIEHPEIDEEKLYQYVSGKLVGREWQEYVDSFLDDKDSMALVQSIEKNLETTKKDATLLAKLNVDTFEDPENYDQYYEKGLRDIIKNEHIKFCQKKN